MLNPCCDLPSVDQPDIEPDDKTPPRDPYDDARDVLRNAGFKRLSSRADAGDWIREQWKKLGAESVALNLSTHGGLWGTWWCGSFCGPVHKPLGLEVLRHVIGDKPCV